MSRVDLDMPGFHTWMTDAACTQYAPDMWTADRGETHLVRQAKTICETKCPAKIRAQCLEYALDNNEQYGVWGGLDYDERRALQRRSVKRPA